MNRRDFVKTAALGAASFTMPQPKLADDPELTPIWAQIAKQHGETVQRLQHWIRQPSIAAENRGMMEGCDLTMQMLREAGFAQVTKIPTDGQPGIFAVLDAGAPRTLGVYYMYDVKQVDPAERSSSAAARSIRKARKPHSWPRSTPSAARARSRRSIWCLLLKARKRLVRRIFRR